MRQLDLKSCLGDFKSHCCQISILIKYVIKNLYAIFMYNFCHLSGEF